MPSANQPLLLLHKPQPKIYESWEEDFFFIIIGPQFAVCVICQVGVETVTKASLKRHFHQKAGHSDLFGKYENDERQQFENCKIESAQNRFYFAKGSAH